MRVKRVSADDVKLHDMTKVKLKTAGNTQVVQFTAGNNKSCPVRNLSKDEYLDKKTGEVKPKKKSENRYESPKSVRKSINRLMDLIRCNATDPAKLLSSKLKILQSSYYLSYSQCFARVKCRLSSAENPSCKLST